MLIFGGTKRLLTSVELQTIVICCRLVITAPLHIAPYFKLLHFSHCNMASITKDYSYQKCTTLRHMTILYVYKVICNMCLKPRAMFCVEVVEK